MKPDLTSPMTIINGLAPTRSCAKIHEVQICY